jgi:hypothetical protein
VLEGLISSEKVASNQVLLSIVHVCMAKANCFEVALGMLETKTPLVR